MRIYPAVHYTMGGLWVDYDLQSTIPGLFVIGEANFSDHGANRLGASRADAGPGRRLLRAAEHHRRLPGRRPVRRRSTPATRRWSRRGREVEDRIAAAARGQRRPDRRLLPPRAGPDHVGPLRHGAHRGGPAQGARRDPGAARASSGSGVKVPGRRRGAQPVAGEGRPGRRLLRAGRADVHRRAAPRASPAAATSGPRARPPTARRCATTSDFALRRGLGVHRRRRAARAAQGRPGLRVRPPDASGATSEAHPARLAPDGRRATRAGWSPTRSTTSPRTCRSWRCSTCSTSG